MIMMTDSTYPFTQLPCPPRLPPRSTPRGRKPLLNTNPLPSWGIRPLPAKEDSKPMIQEI